jgi:hypothetical protein
LRPNPFAKKLQTQIVSTLKLRKTLVYEKAAHKILVKLTTDGIMGLGYILQLLFSEKYQNL